MLEDISQLKFSQKFESCSLLVYSSARTLGVKAVWNFWTRVRSPKDYFCDFVRMSLPDNLYNFYRWFCLILNQGWGAGARGAALFGRSHFIFSSGAGAL